MFKVGDNAVYPAHGVTVVKRIEEREVGGKKKSFYVLQVVDRRPEGSPARLEWIREDLRERIAIDRRRALIARQVQALRTEAMAAGRLDVPGTSTAESR